MKILILVLSYNSPPYDALMLAQQETFDSIEVEGVRTVYYHGRSENWIKPKRGEHFVHYRHHIDGCPWIEQREFDCTDSYFFMAEKLQLVLDEVIDYPYDYIFRTNSSSYVNKQRLKEFAATLPTEKLYAGWEINGNEGFNIISGAGFFLSRDTADLLRENIDPTFEKEEDYYCAQILHEHGIKIIDNKSRIDYPQERGKDFNSAYHIRFKGPSGNRLEDAENMKKVHKIITQNG